MDPISPQKNGPRNKTDHIVFVQRITRGQSLRDSSPFEVARFSRWKEATGQAKALRNSYGDLLVEKFWEQEYILEYEEYDNYYIFNILDNEGLFHECHIWVQQGQVLR